MVKAQKKTGDPQMQATNTASVVDGKLILSFLIAKTPVVWQMDLNKAQSCALEIKEDKKKKEFALCIKTDSQNSEEIALFEKKEQAVEALMTTSAALQNASGRINQTVAAATIQPGSVEPFPAHQMVAPQNKNENKKAAILAFVLVIALIIIWSVSVPRNSGPLLSSNQLGNTGTVGSVSGGNSTGVPLSADDFLTNR